MLATTLMVGAAGVWRRAAIMQVGGWKSRTTVEDMDLSLRTFLAGWKAVFLANVTCVNEVRASPTLHAPLARDPDPDSIQSENSRMTVEDMHLSLRTFLAGWKAMFLANVTCVNKVGTLVDKAAAG